MRFTSSNTATYPLCKMCSALQHVYTERSDGGNCKKPLLYQVSLFCYNHTECACSPLFIYLCIQSMLLHWLISSADFEIKNSQVHEILLKNVVELFLAIRGYAIT